MSKLKLSLIAVLVVCLLATILPVWALTSDINPTTNTAAAQSVTTIVDLDTIWRYLDDGTDPAAGNSNSACWTLPTFDDRAWKQAAGKFGSKSGALADLGSGYVPTVLLKHYLNGSSGNTVPAYFFRTTVTLDRTYSGSVSGTVLYDDSAIIYINGTKVAGFDDSSLTGNLSYGGSNAGIPKTGSFSFDASMLNRGENIIAVEVHNGKESSSDEWFSMPQISIDESVEAPKEKAVCITVGSNETERNITWYSPSAATSASVEYAIKGVDEAFPTEYSIASATVKSSNDGGYYSCQATLTNLKADTEYVYRFVNGGIKSKNYTFNTDAEGDFDFIVVGDPQIGASGSVSSDNDSWNNTMAVIAENFPDSNLMISAGDQVDASKTEEYDAYLSPKAMSSLTTATVIGNHDTGSSSYSQHFYNPNTKTSDGVVCGSTAAGSDYWYIYNNVLFLNLNSNNMSTAEHKAFMEDAVAQNPHVLWKVVVFHHSIYSAASHSQGNDIITRRNDLVPIFNDLDVDVVLMGHDHVYIRSYMMNGLTPDNANGVQSSVTDPEGILYLTASSSTGSKYYDLMSANLEYVAVKSQEYTPLFSNVEVTATSFKITTYRVNDVSVVDEFEIKKSKAEALEHSVKYVESCDPKCEENGNTAYYACGDCDRYYEDEDCTKEIKDKSSVIVAATGHLDVTHFDRIPANCLIDGNIEYWHCNDCGNDYKDFAYTKHTDNVVIASRGGHSGGETYYSDDYHWTLCEYCAEPYDREEHSDNCDCGYTN